MYDPLVTTTTTAENTTKGLSIDISGLNHTFVDNKLSPLYESEAETPVSVNDKRDSSKNRMRFSHIRQLESNLVLNDKDRESGCNMQTEDLVTTFPLIRSNNQDIQVVHSKEISLDR